MVGRIPRQVGWADVVLAAIDALPRIIAALELNVPEPKQGDEKLRRAINGMKDSEPMVVETDELKAAREAAISAQVRYANALAAATVTHGA